MPRARAQLRCSSMSCQVAMMYRRCVHQRRGLLPHGAYMCGAAGARLHSNVARLVLHEDEVVLLTPDLRSELVRDVLQGRLQPALHHAQVRAHALLQRHGAGRRAGAGRRCRLAVGVPARAAGCSAPALRTALRTSWAGSRRLCVTHCNKRIPPPLFVRHGGRTGSESVPVFMTWQVRSFEDGDAQCAHNQRNRSQLLTSAPSAGC